MKVLHVTTTLSIAHGGDTRACAELCESLAQAGVEVTLVYLRDPGREEFRLPRVRLIGLDGSLGRIGSRLAYSRRMRPTLEAWVPKSDLLHLHCLWRHPNYVAAEIARRHSIPYIVQPHGCLLRRRLQYKGIRKRLYGALFEQRVLRHARAILVDSEGEKVDVLRYLPGANVVVVPCGAYSAKLSSAVPLGSVSERWPELEGRRIVLYLGQIHPIKGIDLLLQAFQAASASREEWRLLLAGPDNSGARPQLEKLARQLAIDGKVVWAGMVSEEEKRLALQACDFFVLPSLSESFGISVLEALLSGRPVITTTETPWSQLGEIGAGVVVPPSIDRLKEALELWMALPRPQLDEMGRRGQAFAQAEYDWSLVAPRVREAYRRILDSL